MVSGPLRDRHATARGSRAMKNAASIDPDVKGVVADGFEGLVPAFREGLDDITAGGAALSLYHQGSEVVSLWAGVADPRTGRAWTDDTPSVLFSVSKGLTALVVALLAQDGRIDIDAPVADAWPEFGCHGKSRLTLGDVLAHRAGLSAPRSDLSLEDVLDHDRWAADIAAQEPLWTPGAGHSYHALTFGPIVQEVIRRVTGLELQQHFQELIARPLAADATLKAAADVLDRAAFLTETEGYRSAATAEIEHWAERAQTLGGAFRRIRADGFNDRRVRAAGLAASGGVGTAAALARIWSSVVVETGGVRLLEDDSITRLCRPRSEGPTVFSPQQPYQRWGAGVLLCSEAAPWFTPESFGHGGVGGQAGIADPGLKVGLGYVRSRLDVHDPVPGIIRQIRQILS